MKNNLRQAFFNMILLMQDILIYKQYPRRNTTKPAEGFKEVQTKDNEEHSLSLLTTVSHTMCVIIRTLSGIAPSYSIYFHFSHLSQND